MTGLRIVLDNGEADDAAIVPRLPTVATGESWKSGELPLVTTGNPRLQDIVSSVATLLDQHQETIQTCRPGTAFNRCGYLLHDVLGPESLDLPRLLTGSEGTLALITEATLATIPLPASRAVVLLGFANLDGALRRTGCPTHQSDGLRIDRPAAVAPGPDL